MANKQDSFAVRLIRLRTTKGWTGSELARRANIEPNRIYQWEGGLSYPSFVNLVALHTAFSVSIDFLCGVTDDA